MRNELTPVPRETIDTNPFDKEVAEILNQARGLVGEKNWEQLGLLVKQLNPDLLSTTQILPQIHELLFTEDLKYLPELYHTNPDKYYAEEAASQTVLGIGVEVVNKMGSNPGNLDYLRRILEERRVPERAKVAYSEQASIGVDLEEYYNAIYYESVVAALSKMNTGQSIALAGEILLEIDEEAVQYYRQKGMLRENDFTEESNEADKNHFDYIMAMEKNDPASARFYSDGTFGCEGLKKKILAVLRESKRPESITLIVSFVKKSGADAPLYFESVLDALKAIDKSKSASVLLELARTGDEFAKRSALHLLYRLESGQVGISEEGVEYLQKIYNVGEYNSDDYYAQRITRRGQIGIFEKASNKFRQYFELQGLDSQEQVIQAKLLDLTYATLFTPRANETAEERAEREKFLAEFQEKYFKFFSGDFFDQAGVQFSNLSFPEQAGFMSFYLEADDATKDRISTFCQKFGLNGLRAFLSLDRGGRQMGESILVIGEKIDSKLANKIFSRYAELVDLTEMTEEAIIDQLGSAQGFSIESLDKIRENLLRGGKELLVKYASKIGKEPSKDSAVKFERFKSGIILFASVVKELIRQPGFSVEKFVDSTIEIKDSSGLSEVEKSEMIEIFITGRGENKYTEEMREDSIKSFRRLLDEPGHEFVLGSTVQGEIITFVRTDRISGNQIYIGSYNRAQETKDTPLAAILARKVIERLGVQNDLIADVYEKNPALRYYKMLGFKQAEVVENYKGRGERYIKLVRPKSGKELPELDRAA